MPKDNAMDEMMAAESEYADAAGGLQEVAKTSKSNRTLWRCSWTQSRSRSTARFQNIL